MADFTKDDVACLRSNAYGIQMITVFFDLTLKGETPEEAATRLDGMKIEVAKLRDIADRMERSLDA